MKILHEFFTRKFSWYARWHAHPKHPHTHLLILAVAALLPLAGVLVSIQRQQIELPELFTSSLSQGARSRRVSPGGIAGTSADHILVKFKPTVGAAKRTEVLSRHGLAVRNNLAALDIQMVTLPAAESPAAAVQKLLNEDSALVEFAEVDAELAPTNTPDDPWFLNWQKDKQWIGAETAWNTVTGSLQLIVAVADTGVDCAHEDLVSRCISGWGLNFYDNSADAHDVNGHGTKVAGVIAAEGNNGLGVAGAVWNAEILPLRVSDLAGNASYAAIANAITYAADHGAKVVNVSYQASGSRSVRSAGAYMMKRGGLVIVSAGNAGTPDGYSASQNLVVVSATDPTDTVYSWSSFGDDVDAAAPGCTGATTKNGGGYDSFCGTSNSAPEVAGVLMLIWSAQPSLSADQAQNILFTTAVDLGAPGWDTVYGWGRIDAGAAVAKALVTAPAATLPAKKSAPGQSTK